MIFHSIVYEITLQVKLWQIPEAVITEEGLNPLLTLSAGNKRVENVLWHPTADGVLCASTGEVVKVYDIDSGSEQYGLYFYF